MFDTPVTTAHRAQIAKITGKFLRKANLSKSETAWQDYYRLGMDAVTRYCRKEGLPLLGDHMIEASNALQG